MIIGKSLTDYINQAANDWTNPPQGTLISVYDLAGNPVFGTATSDIPPTVYLTDNGYGVPGFVSMPDRGAFYLDMQDIYAKVASGEITVSVAEFPKLLSSDNLAVSKNEFAAFSPFVRAWAILNPQAWMADLEAHRNPANHDLASMGAEGGYSNPGGITVDPATGRIDYAGAGYMTVHDNGIGLGTLFAVASIVCTIAFPEFMPGLWSELLSGIEESQTVADIMSTLGMAQDSVTVAKDLIDTAQTTLQLDATATPFTAIQDAAQAYGDVTTQAQINAALEQYAIDNGTASVVGTAAYDVTTQAEIDAANLQYAADTAAIAQNAANLIPSTAISTVPPIIPPGPTNVDLALKYLSAGTGALTLINRLTGAATAIPISSRQITANAPYGVNLATGQPNPAPVLTPASNPSMVFGSSFFWPVLIVGGAALLMKGK